MTPTTFDTEFQRLTTEMVEIAFEYIGFNKEEVDGIYIYASMEFGIYFYNAFFKINNQLIEKETVNSVLLNKTDTSSQVIQSLLSIGGAALMDFSDVFENDSREVPTLLKMVYQPKNGGFDCDIIYESQSAIIPNWTNVKAFENWFKEMQTT